jgi:shikimate kinase
MFVAMGNKPLWLVGMMGAGKSVVGLRLAQELGRRFVDTDAEIERSAGHSINEIFAREGEAGFRVRERHAIEALYGSSDVVSLGGGAIAQAGAADSLSEAGMVVYLKASPATLLARLGKCLRRPLLCDLNPEARLAKVEALMAERRVAYESATIVIDTDSLTVDGTVEEISRRLSAERGENRETDKEERS